MSEEDKIILKVYYQKAVKDAKKNLKGEDLEKCLIALNNYMDHYIKWTNQKNN